MYEMGSPTAYRYLLPQGMRFLPRPAGRYMYVVPGSGKNRDQINQARKKSRVGEDFDGFRPRWHPQIRLDRVAHEPREGVGQVPQYTTQIHRSLLLAFCSWCYSCVPPPCILALSRHEESSSRYFHFVLLLLPPPSVLSSVRGSKPHPFASLQQTIPGI